jgi:hypothetical protein
MGSQYLERERGVDVSMNKPKWNGWTGGGEKKGGGAKGVDIY